MELHQTSVSMIKAAPAELFAGGDIALKVKVLCSSKCNLEGGKVIIAADASVVLESITLDSFNGVANESGEFVLRAPSEPGEYAWTAIYIEQENIGILHEASSASFSFVVKPHAISMAVWDVPSPIVLGDKFKIKVGVQCSAECRLGGKDIIVCDHTGTPVATRALGDVCWSGTDKLYWTEVELQAPGAEGTYTWETRFRKKDLEIPHEEASYAFSFKTARQPEHVVTIEVMDKDKSVPIDHAQVVLHPYRSYADERGIARLRVPTGDYELYISWGNKQLFQTTVKVASDVAVRAELVDYPYVDTSG